jgi:hypothetical protein
MKTSHLAAVLGATLVFSIGGVSVSSAQEEGTGSATSEPSPAKDSPSPKTNVSTESNVTKTPQGRPVGLVGRFIGDQREIWTSPRRFRFSDTEWLVPLGGLTAGLFVTDREFSRHLSHNPTTISHYKSLSNAGLAALYTDSRRKAAAPPSSVDSISGRRSFLRVDSSSCTYGRTSPASSTFSSASLSNRAHYWVSSNLGLSASVQYERWLFPMIQPGAQRNAAASLEIPFQPQKTFRPSLHSVSRDVVDQGDSN